MILLIYLMLLHLYQQNILLTSCSQKCSTIEAPIPEPPPVIKILLFFKSEYLPVTIIFFLR